MKISLNHNRNLFNKIDNYVNGNMSSAEKHSFEKEALDNPFLQDAIDGYQLNKGSIQHFNNNLITKYKFNILFKYGIFTIGFLLIFSAIIYFSNNNVKNKQQITSTIDSITNKNIVQSKIEVIPVELETLTVIQSNDEIKHKNLVINFNNNPTYQSIDKKDKVVIDTSKIVINEIIKPIEEPEEEPIELITKQTKKVYPFKYFYNMAVVDYTLYDNREKSIDKTTYMFTGVDASKESANSNNATQFTEQVIQVSYMDYLKESMWYFSKGKYKNALKRYNNIASQYKNDYNALFYGGLSNYNLKRFKFALQNFTTIIELGEGPFYDEALWYKAKTHLKMNNKSAAKTDLEQVIINNGFYTKKAIELLKSL